MNARQPAAAGRFYPARGDDLARVVDSLLAAARPSVEDGELRAVVAPHAGYVYSGDVAAKAFAAAGSRAAGARVVLLGPSHFVALRGAAVSGADSWLTPLGAVAIDDDLRELAVAAGAAVDDEPHAADHALEVELPFLQRALGEPLHALMVAVGDDDKAAAVVAAVCAAALVVVSTDLSHYHDDATARSLDHATAEAVVSLDAAAIGDDDKAAAVVAAVCAAALVVVSTDLSHYHDDATARSLDRATADAVVSLDAAAIGDDDACGAAALRGLVLHARRAGWTATLLSLDTSAAAAHDTRRVVGYGAFAFASTRAGA